MSSKIKCEVVRDLMPLVIDDVASEGSKKLVNEHMEDCEGCRGYYAGMTAAISRSAVPPESDKSFIKLGKRMKRKVSLKKIIALMMVLMVLFFSGLKFWDWANQWKVMPHDWADVQLCCDYDGRVYAQIDVRNGPGWYGTYGIEHEGGIYYINPRMPNLTLSSGSMDALELVYDLTMRDGQLCVKTVEYEHVVDPNTGNVDTNRVEVVRPVDYVRWGQYNGFTTIYAPGDQLPLLDGLNQNPTEDDEPMKVYHISGSTPVPVSTEAANTPEPTDAAADSTLTPAPAAAENSPEPTAEPQG